MSGAKEVRMKYGLTQEQLALYLDVTVGLLKMVEISRRELPLAALLKLNKLALHTVPPFFELTTIAPNTSIEKEKRKLRLKKQKLEIELEEMQTAYQQAVNGLALAQHFLQEAPIDKGEELMLQLLERKAKQTLKKCSLEEQAYLEWWIGWLEKMVE